MVNNGRRGATLSLSFWGEIVKNLTSLCPGGRGHFAQKVDHKQTKVCAF
jgi:hypothetical protein